MAGFGNAGDIAAKNRRTIESASRTKTDGIKFANTLNNAQAVVVALINAGQPDLIALTPEEAMNRIFALQDTILERQDGGLSDTEELQQAVSIVKQVLPGSTVIAADPDPTKRAEVNAGDPAENGNPNGHVKRALAVSVGKGKTFQTLVDEGKSWGLIKWFGKAEAEHQPGKAPSEEKRLAAQAVWAWASDNGMIPERR